MHAKPLTLGVIVATVISAVTLVSGQIDKQDAQFAVRPVSLQQLVQSQGEPLAKASPITLDPRRMAAPVGSEPTDATTADERATDRTTSSARDTMDKVAVSFVR